MRVQFLADELPVEFSPGALEETIDRDRHHDDDPSHPPT
jgi:hypothetical protein